MKIEHFGEAVGNIAVCIPAYNEGSDVIGTLKALIAQEVRDVVFNVVLVVNAPADAKPEVVASNQETVQALKAFINDIGEHPLFVQQQIAFTLIQIFGDHALAECNVGVARAVAASEALKIIQSSREEFDNRVLVNTDADSYLNPQYIQACQDAFEANPEVAALTGPVKYVPKGSLKAVDDRASLVRVHREEDESASWYRLHKIRQRLDYLIDRFIVSSLKDAKFKEQGYNIIPGSNGAVRASAYQEAGGFKSMAGAEDLSLSLKLIELGHKIHWSYDMGIETNFRVSLRTNKGDGLGFYVDDLRNYLYEFENLPFSSIDSVVLLETLVEAINKLIAQHDDIDELKWKAELNEVERFTDEELHELWKEFLIAPRVANVRANNFLMKSLSKMIGKRCPLITIEGTINELIELIGEDDHCAGDLGEPFYEKVLADKRVLDLLDYAGLNDYYQAVFGYKEFNEVEADGMEGQYFISDKIQYLEALEKIKLIDKYYQRIESIIRRAIAEKELPDDTVDNIIAVIKKCRQNNLEICILDYQIHVLNVETDSNVHAQNLCTTEFERLGKIEENQGLFGEIKTLLWIFNQTYPNSYVDSLNSLLRQLHTLSE